VLGSAVGGVIVVTNARPLLDDDLLYAALYVLWAAAVGHSIRAHLKERAALDTEPVPERKTVGT
jgi:hypothetical protein